MGIYRLAFHWFLFATIVFLVENGYAQQTLSPGGKSTDLSRLAGTWTGSLDVGAIRLHLVFNITLRGDQLVSTLDSPDQGAKGIPLDSVRCNGPTLEIVSTKLNAKYVGILDNTGEKLNGTWSQNGREFSLNLIRTVGTTDRLRPQTPRPPFNYRVEEVTYPHQAAKFNFGATLTLPNKDGRMPAVVLVSGSGAQDRDESIFEHKPFAVLADHLTNAGMVVLRVDDRGVGSTGLDENPQDDTTADFATDVKSSLAYLRARPEVDPNRIGLIGHSEGALVGTMVAAEDKGIAFLILLAGPAVPGDELLALQSEKIARASGASEEEIKRLREMQRQIFSIIRNQPDIEVGKREAREILLAEYAKLNEEERKSVGSADIFADQHSAVIGVPWFRYFITFDPKTVLAKVGCPVLALTGDKDLQVPAEQNLPQIHRSLMEGQGQEVKVKVLPNLNHLLQTANSGLVTEYGEIEETIAPIALAEISDWLSLRGLIQ